MSNLGNSANQAYMNYLNYSVNGPYNYGSYGDWQDAWRRTVANSYTSNPTTQNPPQTKATFGQKLGNFSSSPIGQAAMGVGLEAAENMPGYKRGIFDAADPLYHLAGNNKTVVGEGLSDAGVGLFKAGAQSGNPMLMLAGGIAKGVGSGINALFGTGVDEKKLAAAKEGTNALRNFNSAAKSFDAIQGPAAQANVQNAYSSGLLRGGWASRRNKKLRQERADADKWAYRAVDNNVNNIMGDQISEGLANYAAFGGPMGMYPAVPSMGGAIDYNFMSDYLTMKNNQIAAKNTGYSYNPNMYFALGGDLEETSPVDATYINRSLLMSPISSSYYKKGNTYHSDKYGDVTIDWAGNYWTALKSSNAGSNENWRHMLNSEEIEDFKKDHENYYNTVSVATNIPLILGISKNPELDKTIAKHYPMRESFKQDFALGGDIQTHGGDFTTGAVHVDAGGTHENSPYDGVQMGVDRQGIPNLVEEDEVIYDDYVYSTRIPCDEQTKKKFHINKKKDITYADLAKKLEKEIAERPNDPISQAGFSAQMHDLADEQERQKQEMEAQRARAAFESLSDEEKVALMQRTAQEEQMAQEAIAQQAMQEQAAQQQTQISPEEAAMMEQQMAAQQEAVPQEEMAEGGHIYAPGGQINPYAYDNNWDGFMYFNPKTGEYDKGYLDFVNNINQEWVDRLLRGEFGELSRYSARNKGVTPTIAQVIKLASDKKYSDMHKAMARAYDEYMKTKSPGLAFPETAITTPTPNDDAQFVRTESQLEGVQPEDNTPVRLPVTGQPIGVTPAEIAAAEAEAARQAEMTATTRAEASKNSGSTTGSDGDADKYPKNHPLRYVGLLGPAVGLGLMAAGVGKPDYSALNAAVAGMGDPVLADYKPIGNYLTYRPMDIWYEQNRLNANARATDRAIMNNATSATSKMAGLLANAYNNQLASGNLYRQALEYNDALKRQVEEFNRGTNQFNAEAYNKLSQFNAEAANSHRQSRAKLGVSAAQQKLDSDASWYNSLYGNISGLFRGLGDLGRENTDRNWLNWYIDRVGVPGTAKRSKGGKLRNKKGFTY